MFSKGEQYFPTYKFAETSRDVLLKEFEEAQKIANTQTQAYAQVSNLILLAVAIIIPLFLSKEKYSIDVIDNYSLLFTLVVYIFGGILLRYFVEIQKQITFNARKVITLRLMLGIDYGHINLTLPNWRVEGATNPFVIKFFSGWFNFQTMPFWILSIAVNIIYLVSINLDDLNSFINSLDSPYKNLNVYKLKYFGNILITFTYYYLFRKNLFDRHENLYFIFIKRIANIFRLKVHLDTEYILYRAKLSVIELQRMQIDYTNIYKILVLIEDKNYYKHKGVVLSSLIRSFLSQSKFIRNIINEKYGTNKGKVLKSGGSTITMQLSRTLFIETSQNLVKRKLFEILFSFWLNKQFSKNEILDFYIASVRFEKGKMGLISAVGHFFKDKKKLSNEECFVLVERLSNVSSTYRKERIKYLVKMLKDNNVILDKNRIDSIYSTLEEENKIKENKKK